MTAVLFIHSAGSQNPGEGSSRLVAGLRETMPREWTLLAPLMPAPDSPEAEPWIQACQAEINAVNDNFVLVGHSLGGSIILQTLARFGIPGRLQGVVTLAAPFWAAGGWNVAEFTLPEDASEKLKTLSRLIIMQGDKDEVVASDHPERYSQVLPQAEIRLLKGVDHEAANAAPEVVKAIKTITGA